MTLVSTPRLALNLEVRGQGPGLLFIGGSNFDLGLDPSVWDSVLPQYFTVAAADPRGLGLTEQPPGEWTMADYAADAVAALDALGWQDALVVGESFGGMIALNMAVHAQERIRRLVISVSAPGGQGARSYPLHEVFALSDLRARAEAWLRLTDVRFDDRPGTARTAEIDMRVVEEAAFLAHARNAQGYPCLLAARRGHDCLAALPALTIPTLVLAGQYDGVAPPHLSRRMADDLPDGMLAEFDAGHGLLFNEPTAMTAVLAHLKEPQT